MRTPQPRRHPAATNLEPLEPRTHFAAVPARSETFTDVAISITAVSAETLSAGSRLNVTALLQNVGTTPITDRTVNLRGLFSTDNKLSASDRVLFDLDRRVTLQPDQIRQIPIAIDVPRDLTARTYNFIASLSPGTPDAKKSNNTFRWATPIRVTAPTTSSKVDYSLSFASTLPSSFPFGVPNPVFLNLRNVGTADATKPITINLYASPDNIFGNGNDILLRSLTYNQTLKPKATAKLDATFTTPITFSTGMYYVAAKADATNTLKEPNETNNITISKLRVHF